MNKLILLIYLFAVLTSCTKEEHKTNELNKNLLGRWLEVRSDFTSINFMRVSRFQQFERGLVIFDDKTIVERSDGGVCIGDFCLTEDYNGTYEIIDEVTIKIKVTNFKGPIEYILKFDIIDSQNIKAQKL